MKVLIVDGSKGAAEDPTVDALGRADQRRASRVRSRDVQTRALRGRERVDPMWSSPDADAPGWRWHVPRSSEDSRRSQRSPSVVVVARDAERRAARPLPRRRRRFYLERRPRASRSAGRRHVPRPLAVGRSRSDDSLAPARRMTAGIVHDVNNYLTSIEMTVLDASSVSRGRDAAGERCVARSMRLQRLNGTLLAYARGAAPETSADRAVGPRARRARDFATRRFRATITIDDRDLARWRAPGSRRAQLELEQLVLNLVHQRMRLRCRTVVRFDVAVTRARRLRRSISNRRQRTGLEATMRPPRTRS